MVGLHPLKPVSAPLGVIAAGVSGVVVLGPCIGGHPLDLTGADDRAQNTGFLQHTGF